MHIYIYIYIYIHHGTYFCTVELWAIYTASPQHGSHGPLQLCAKAWTCRWWMAHYRSRTPKRQVGWSNSPAIGLLDMGKLCHFPFNTQEYEKNRTAKVTISKSGKEQFTGQRKQLKQSQCLNWKQLPFFNFRSCIVTLGLGIGMVLSKVMGCWLNLNSSIHAKITS